MPATNLLKQWMWIGLGFIVGTFLLVTTPASAATAHQICQQGSLCTIGEFVYTDAAVPITNATCQFTSFTPSGQSFVNAASLTGTADGWYGYSFTPDQTTALGSYPSQLCCQTNENNLCIDKSFEVAVAPTSASDISTAVWNATISSTTPGSFGSKVEELQNNTLSATDIWSYSGRTLSNFGTLVSDIASGVWAAATRSLTNTQNITDGIWNANPNDYSNPDSFGQKINTTTNLSAQEVWDYQDRQLTGSENIASSVWNYQNRSLTSFGNLVTSIWSADNRTATDPTGATAASIAVLEREIKAAQTLIQQLAVNGTADQSQSDAPDYAALLIAKLDTTKDYLSQLSNNMEIISTRLGLLAVKWDQLSDSDRIQELEHILTLLGSTESTNLDSVIGQLDWFASHWPRQSTTNLYQNVNGLRTDINDFITTLQLSPNNPAQAAIINQLFATASSLKLDIGDISQSETAPSLYGQYKSHRSLGQALASQLQIINNTLTDWDRLSLADRDSLAQTLTQDVSRLNRFSALRALENPITSTPGHLMNLKAVLTANQAALVTSGEPITVNWIGAGATAYHTFVYNPSRATAQTAAVSYFLPTELTTEHITLTPDPFTATFNPDQNAIAVTGSPSLDPQAHALHTLFTQNIWDINPADINLLRHQANSLTAALEKSPLYPQAVAINQNIDQALDAITHLQRDTQSPEAKIMSYRQIASLKQSVDQGIGELQNLVNASQNTNSLMGFIGGVQAVAVWGMIVIVIAGFIFLSLYMRALYQQTQVEIHGEPELSLPLSGPTAALALPHEIPQAGMDWGRIHLPLGFSLDALTKRRFMVALMFLSSVLLTSVIIKHQPRPPQPAILPASLAPLEPLLGSPEPEAATSPTPLPLGSPEPEAATTSPSDSVLISPPGLDATIDLRRLPSLNSPIITSITTEETVQIATQSGDWIQVRLTHREPMVTGWLQSSLALILPQ